MQRLIVLMYFVLVNSAVVAAPQAAPPAESSAYAVKYRKAKDLTALLERQFKGAAGFRALEDAVTNQILLSGTKNEIADAVRLLAQLDRKPLTIAVDALLFVAAEEKTADGKVVVKALAPKDFTGPAEAIINRIQELKEQKQISELQRIQLTTQEHQRANVKQLEQKPVIRGKTVTATGIVMENKSMMNFGVIMEVTPRLTPEREVMLDVTLDWSRLHTHADGTGVASMSMFSGPVTVTAGQAVLLRAVRTTAPMKDGHTFVVVTAKITP